MFYERRRSRSRRRRRILGFSAQRQKSNLSHADTQLRLARTHERNEYDFPVGERPKEDAQTPNLRHTYKTTLWVIRSFGVGGESMTITNTHTEAHKQTDRQNKRTEKQTNSQAERQTD